MRLKKFSFHLPLSDIFSQFMHSIVLKFPIHNNWVRFEFEFIKLGIPNTGIVL